MVIIFAMKKEELLIGAHISIAGGVPHALTRGAEIGATTIQIFTSNQKQWKGRPIPEEDLILWHSLLKETGIKKVMSHDSYLINLGSPNKEALDKSRATFQEELKRCHALKISYLNFHPGAAVGATEEHCLETIVESLLELEPLTSQGDTRLLLEATAGQGSSVGHRFEHLAYVLDRVKKKIPIGVCIDTCHIFASGYDIRTKQAWETTLREFDRIVGISHLYAFHLNDSMKPFGSRRDRHAQIGKGEIGLEGFKFVMQHPKLRAIPKYLETPDPQKWKEEIQLLRDIA